MSNYNSLFLMTALKRHFCATIVALLLASSACASVFSQPAADLAKTIAAVAGPGPITLSFINSSSLSGNYVAEIQQNLETQLRTLGLRATTATGATTNVRVTLSENLRGYLWVAEIYKVDGTEVRMISVPRAAPAEPAAAAPSVTIQKALLWAGPEPILDASVDNNRLIILEATTVSIFSLASGAWKLEQSVPLLHDHDFPRDLRGLLVPGKDKDRIADLYLPGTSCRLTRNASYAVACLDGDDPWPLGVQTALFNSARNYFTGALFGTAVGSVPPFYSVASFERNGSLFSIFAGVDGSLRTSDATTQNTLPTSATSDWGSDIAAVKSGCGSGTQLLVTGVGDDATTDTLRAFEFPDRRPVQVSMATDFPGPITALWTHNDGANVTAVVHNLHTGSYEAYTVSVTCNR